MVSVWLRGKYSPSNVTAKYASPLPRREHAIIIAELLKEPVDLVLLLSGHAPEGDPHMAYCSLRDAPNGAAVKATKKVRLLLAKAQGLLEAAQ